VTLPLYSKIDSANREMWFETKKEGSDGL
jgi:hypothetical protein